MMFSCFASKEVFASSGRTDASGRVNSWQISYLSRIPGEDFGYFKKSTRNNRYKMCKVQWSNHTEEEATWEKEDQLTAEFSDIFSNLSKSQGRDSF
jgi:hypothetical protein